MPHRVPGALAVLLLTFPLFAARDVTSISPAVGFPYGGTHVTISGTELVEAFVHCDDECQNPGPCPVTVLFGDAAAEVVFALPDRILVIAPPHAVGKVSVTVKVNGRPTLTRAQFFTYDENAIVSGADYARYLIPVIAEGTAGAHGSNWVTETTVLNASNATVYLDGPFCTEMTDICAVPSYEPGRYETLLLPPGGGGRDGVFVYVPKPLDHDIALESRVRDTSVSDANWGTELPVVRQSEFGYALYLLDVPTDARYRATLRVYGDRPTRALIRVLRQSATVGEEELIEEYSHALTGDPQRTKDFPLYLQLDPLSPAVRVQNGKPVRIEVYVDDDSIIDPPPVIWAFLSITNNETQQVTTITPRH